MSDALSAIEVAAFNALSAGVTLAAVFQHVPEDTPVGDPLVIVGDIDADAEALASKDDEDQQVTLTIITIVKAHERAPLLAMQAEVNDALNKIEVTQGGWKLHFVAKDSNAILFTDGETYVGKSTFTIFAFGGS